MACPLTFLGVETMISGASYSAVELSGRDDAVVLLDQRRLPGEATYARYETCGAVELAVREMVVRGAPAIGVAAAYGVVLATREWPDANDDALRTRLAPLRDARPTAVNLAWAVGEMLRAAVGLRGAARTARVASAARHLHRDDVDACREIGRLGAALLPDSARVLTHCNAGALATGGYGTALGVVRAAHEGRRLRGVLACETRPYLQGARLTAWELHADGIPVEVITDGMAAHMMARGEVDTVVVGADRVAANGDVANKIGTYGLAVLARAHGVPFFVAAPTSTLDPRCASGAEIPIEERASDEVLKLGGIRLAPEGVRARHPGFDVTPAAYVGALITERGVARPVDGRSVGALAEVPVGLRRR